MGVPIPSLVCNLTTSVCVCPSSHPVQRGQHCTKGKISQKSVGWKLTSGSTQECCWMKDVILMRNVDILKGTLCALRYLSASLKWDI